MGVAEETALLEGGLPGAWHGVPRLWVPRGALREGACARVGVRAVCDEGAVGDEELGHGDSAFPALGIDGVDVVVVDHGGSRTSDTRVHRAVAAGAVVDVVTGRTPRALTADEWDEVEGLFIREGLRALEAGAAGVVLEVGRGRLWHGALSPLLSGGVATEGVLARMGRILGAWRARTERVGVALCVEEVVPGGIHVGMARAWAARLVGAGATLVVVRVGGPHMRARMVGASPRVMAEEGQGLAACGWLKRDVAGAVMMASGGLVSKEVMGAAVARGFCDGCVVDVPRGEEGAA